MKKELVIEMEEECVDCPCLELVTRKIDMVGKIHECKYLQLCKSVRKNWERFQQNCDECDREESGPFGRSNY